jgi:hypothetical protein
MICATREYAAVQPTTPVVANHTQTKRTIHGKKQDCAQHGMHKLHTLATKQVAAKKK